MSSVGYAILVASFSLEVYILVRALLRGDFRRYLSLNLFVAAMALRDVSGYLIYLRYGLASAQYTYVYFYTDALLTVLMYLAIMQLCGEVFRAMHYGKYVRWVTVGLLAGTALFCWGVIQSNTNHLTTPFVIELSQDLYFVGMVLTYLLWIAVFKLRETRARLVQLVLALGVYFSATAAIYALRNMFPAMHEVTSLAGWYLGVLLLLSWAYTFTRVPEDARLAPGRLMEGLVTHR